MRWLAAAFLIFAGFATPALAQKPAEAPAPAHAQETPAPIQSEENVAAASELLQVLLVESNIMPHAIQELWAPQMTRLRALYATLPIAKERRTAATAFLDTVPTLLLEEINAFLPGVIERAAPELAARLASEDIRAMTAFMRSDPGREVLLSTVTGAPLSADAEAANAAFSASPSGQRLNAQSDVLSQVLGEALEEGSGPLLDRVRARTATGLCAALEDDCPPALRQGQLDI